MSQLELFANELLFDIFESLSTAHLIHAFSGLNSRFNQLLYAHFQTHQIDLQSIGNYDFDVLCQEYLPILIDKIISLRLSNNMETPNLYELFLSRGFTFDRFIHLQSLSLHHINSLYTINQIIVQCRYLLYLNHFNLIDCLVNQYSNDTTAMMNNIWNLPKLTHFTINNLTKTGSCLYKLSVVSLSIEYVSINTMSNDGPMLNHLFEYTPCLQRLHINNTCWNSSYTQHEPIFSSLISLKTFFTSNANSMIDLLKRFPNLCYLSLKISDIRMDGNNWKDLFVNHLPKLKKFHLKMNLDFSSTDNAHIEIDQLVDSFRTSFWLEQHQWYIRCDCYSSNKCSHAILYTLPYAFDQCSYLNAHYWISTKPDDEEFSSCKCVQFLNMKTIQIKSFNDLNHLNICFPNIPYLEITLPLIDEFEIFNLSFSQLISLHVKLNSAFGYSHLQILLDRAQQLYLLKFHSFGGSPEGLFQLTSSSIRRLDLIVAQLHHGTFFSHEDCMDLINSPLGRQCEVLLMEFENRTDIIHVIEQIPNLRMLIFRCKDVILNYLKSPSINKNFIRWLKQNLSSKSTILTNPSGGSKISLWIYRKTNQSLSTTDYPLTLSERLKLRFFEAVQRLYFRYTRLD
jgi:hypothetical protein